MPGEIASAPCQAFNKSKAITCYKLRLNLDLKTFTHIEFLRLFSNAPNEYYVLPIETLQKKAVRHISYHKSGAFHVREKDGLMVKMLDHEADIRRVELLMQALEYMYGRLEGYCIAQGKGVSGDALQAMVKILDGYVIPPLGRLAVIESLRKNRSATVSMLLPWYRMAARRITAEEDASGSRVVLSREELYSILRAHHIPDEKIVFLEPGTDRYIVYSERTFGRLLRLGHRMVAEKMCQRANGFWTVGSGHVAGF